MMVFWVKLKVIEEYKWYILEIKNIFYHHVWITFFPRLYWTFFIHMKLFYSLRKFETKASNVLYFTPKSAMIRKNVLCWLKWQKFFSLIAH